MTIELDDVIYREVMLEDTKRRLTEAVSGLVRIYEAYDVALTIPCLAGLRKDLERRKKEIDDCLGEI